MSETRFRPWPSSHALARWGWAVAVVVVALQAATHLVNALVLDRQRRWLDAAVDASIFGRMNTVAIGLCALFAAVGAALGARTARRLLLSLALLVLAADDATGVHDRIRDLPRTVELGAAAAFALLLGLVLVLLLLEARQAPPVARWLLGAGLVALGLAVVVRVVGAAGNVGHGIGDTKKAFGVAAEQGLDLGGWILVASGLAASLARTELASSTFFAAAALPRVHSDARGKGGLGEHDRADLP
jgi:hypothetical protein